MKKIAIALIAFCAGAWLAMQTAILSHIERGTYRIEYFNGLFVQEYFLGG